MNSNAALQTTAAHDARIVLGSGFYHVLTELRVEKSPLHGGRGWIKVVP
jgi:hypothetical protein